MKWTFLVSLLALISLALCGCQSGDTVAKSGPPTDGAQAKTLKVGIVFDSGGRGDKSFNDSAYRGIERAKSEFKIEERTVDSKSEKDYDPNLSALAEDGCDLVIAVGLNQKNALDDVSKKFPNVKFAIVDAVCDSPNVRSLLFKEEEGSFLAGFVSGLVSKSGKVGFVGGMNIELIHKFMNGFEAGAKTANPKIEMLPPKFTENWDNVDTAKAAAKVLFSDGADVVYAAAGRAGLGVISAAKETGKYAVGVDSDQDYLAEGNVLTSMIKKVDEAVFQSIKDLKDGKFTATKYVYDLKAGGVGLSEMKYTKDKIGADNLKKVQGVSDRIKSRELKVPATDDELKAYLSSVASKN